MRPLPVMWGTKQEPGQEIARTAKKEPEIDDWKEEDLHYLADFPKKRERESDLDATFSIASDGKLYFTSQFKARRGPWSAPGMRISHPRGSWSVRFTNRANISLLELTLSDVVRQDNINPQTVAENSRCQC